MHTYLIRLAIQTFIYVLCFQQTLYANTQRYVLPDSVSINLNPNWDYFTLHDTMEVTLMHHFPAFAPCGIFATASISIVTTKNHDTIRIIDLCNTDTSYVIGHKYTLVPATAPSFSVTLPYCIGDEDTEAAFQNVCSFNFTVRKTTYVTIINNP